VLERSKGDLKIDPHLDLLAVHGVVRIMLGDNDEALRLLGQYFEANPTHRLAFGQSQNLHWWWRGLKDDPRFKALVSADP